MTSKGYRLLPHTADLRVEVRGDDLPSLLAAAAEALFSLLTDRRRVRPKERVVLPVPPGPPDEQMYSLLRRALLLFSVERFLVRRASATMNGEKIAVTLHGESIDPARHALYREIKAVTGHGLVVERGRAGFEARFVLDV